MLFFFFIVLCLLGTTESPPVVSASATGSDVNKTFPEVPQSRRRGLIPNFRRRGDSYLSGIKLRKPKTETKAKDQNATGKGVDINTTDQHILKRPYSGNGNKVTQSLKNVLVEKASKLNSSIVEKGDRARRRRRWDYDENYDWENGGKDYVIPGEEPKQETKFEKFAKSWQKHAIKVIFLFSLISMVCCCCVAICKKFCSKVCETVCWHLKDYRDICLNRDPTWRKARKFADEYGIELNYDQYKQIKKNYEDGFQKQGQHQYRNLSGR